MLTPFEYQHRYFRYQAIFKVLNGLVEPRQKILLHFVEEKWHGLLVFIHNHEHKFHQFFRISLDLGQQFPATNDLVGNRVPKPLVRIYA